MPHAYPPESAFGLQTVLLPDMLGCSACWECNVEFPAKTPYLGGPFSISMGLLQVCVRMDSTRRGGRWSPWEGLSISDTATWSCSGIQTSSTCLRQHEMSHVARHTLTWPCVPCFQPFPATRQSETVTWPPQRRWGLVTHQHSRGGSRTTSRPPSGGGLFFPPLPSCLTHQCL